MKRTNLKDIIKEVLREEYSSMPRLEDDVDTGLPPTTALPEDVIMEIPRTEQAPRPPSGARRLRRRSKGRMLELVKKFKNQIKFNETTGLFERR